MNSFVYDKCRQNCTRLSEWLLLFIFFCMPSTISISVDGNGKSPKRNYLIADSSGLCQLQLWLTNGTLEYIPLKRINGICSTEKIGISQTRQQSLYVCMMYEIDAGLHHILRHFMIFLSFFLVTFHGTMRIRRLNFTMPPLTGLQCSLADVQRFFTMQPQTILLLAGEAKKCLSLDSS